MLNQNEMNQITRQHRSSQILEVLDDFHQSVKNRLDDIFNQMLNTSLKGDVSCVIDTTALNNQALNVIENVLGILGYLVSQETFSDKQECLIVSWDEPHILNLKDDKQEHVIVSWDKPHILNSKDNKQDHLILSWDNPHVITLKDNKQVLTLSMLYPTQYEMKDNVTNVYKARIREYIDDISRKITDNAKNGHYSCQMTFKLGRNVPFTNYDSFGNDLITIIKAHGYRVTETFEYDSNIILHLKISW